MKMPRHIGPWVTYLTLTAISGCGSPSSHDDVVLGCQTIRNGVTISYPCESQEPSEPAEGEVLTAWILGDYTVGDLRQVIIERHDTISSAGEWAMEHMGADIDGAIPAPVVVAGLPGLSYEVSGEDLFESSTSKYIVLRADDSPTYQPVFLITATASSHDQATAQQYINQLQQMIESIELPRFP
jgi:hypothetical protein